MTSSDFLLRTIWIPLLHSQTGEQHRTAHSRFINVDKLIPVSRIEGPEQAWEFTAEPQSLESVVFKDQYGQERQLPEVLDATATQGLVVLQGGRLVAERYSQGYDGTTPHILFSVSKSLTGARGRNFG